MGVVPRKQKNRGKVVDISYRIGTASRHDKPEFLKPTPIDKLSKPLPEAFPRKVSMKRLAERQALEAQMAAKKPHLMSAHEIAALTSLPGLSTSITPVALPSNLPTPTVKPSRKNISNWFSFKGEAPDDLFFKSSLVLKKLRKSKMTTPQLRRIARRANKYRFNLNNI